MSEATSVGQIGLDLVVNKKDFNKQMSGIQNLATKVSKKLAAAFAVKKLVDFSAKCIELGSDLSEVQNVVDVTFPAMSKQVDKFAQNASTAFGLSETMAKKYTGTFGAMAKAFGFGEQQAYDMSTTLTGLAGDVASFYNITQDEAYTKLKSVFTGETESLKDLGVVMTQTALDAYAMANGYGKTTAAMSEAEKVALRYSFVQSKLATASGDFMRTSDGWANQVRILKLQTESFMAAIGQGLINVLTPAIKVINTLMGKLVQLANVFKAFTEKFTGKKADNVASGMQAAEAASAGVSENINAAGKAAKKLGGLLSSDELDLLSQKTDTSAAAGETSGIDIAGLQTATKTAEESADKITQKFSDAFKKIPSVRTFIDQLNNGLKKIDFAGLKKNFTRVTTQLQPLAKTAVKNLETIIDPLGGYMGNRIGNKIAVTVKLVDIGLDGIAGYLEKNSSKIQSWSEDVSQSIANGFINLTEINEQTYNNLLGALDKARPEITKGLEDILTGYNDFGMSLGTILASGFDLATEHTSQWMQDNQELLEGTLTELFEFGGECASLVGQIVGDLGNSLTEWWDSNGSSAFGNIVDAWNDIKKTVLELWNDIVMPVLNHAKEALQELWEENLRPLWDNILELISSVGDFLAATWSTVIKPIIGYLAPTIKQVADIVINIMCTVFATVSDLISGAMKILGGLLDFLTGVFTGNWKKAWESLQKITDGIWQAIWGSIKGVCNLIIDGVNAMISLIYSTLRNVVNGIGSVAKKAGDLVGKDWGFEMPSDPPQIPKLWNGGYVKANTPQLAMIGDNRHQGEIVSPEDKLQKMALSAAQAAAGSGGSISAEKLDKIITLLETIIRILASGNTIEINGVKFAELLKKINREYFKATGNYLLLDV